MPGTAETPDDIQLCQRIVDGDREAFAAFYDRHGSLVFGLAIKMLGDKQLAADVVQDVFLKFWRRREQFDARRGQPMMWLSIICRNRCIDLLRSRKSLGGRRGGRLNGGRGDCRGVRIFGCRL